MIIERERRKLHYMTSCLCEKCRYPLWHGTDVLSLFQGKEYGTNDGSATAYHFHNYFTSAEEIHLKYATYGHAKGDAT
jgi:hypothetical protein